MMKTAEQQLQRMEALVRKMAAQFTKENSNYGAIGAGSSLAYIDTASYREAIAIVSELPEPVDPDLLEARELCCEDIRSNHPDVELEDGYRTGEYDKEDIMRVALAAIRKGRELGREGRK